MYCVFLQHPHKCRFCFNQFDRGAKLKIHQKIHEMDADASKHFEHGDPEKTRRCAVCMKEFSDLARLETHWDKFHNTGLNPFACAYCSERKPEEDLIFQHVLATHKELTIDSQIVLIRDEAMKPEKNANYKYVSPKIAIFVNPIAAAKNTEHEKKRIKSVVAKQLKEQEEQQMLEVEEQQEKEKREAAEPSLVSDKIADKAEEEEIMIIEDAVDPLQDL